MSLHLNVDTVCYSADEYKNKVQNTDILHTERREGKFSLPESRTVKDVISALARLCWHLQTSGAILVVIKDTSVFSF